LWLAHAIYHAMRREESWRALKLPQRIAWAVPRVLSEPQLTGSGCLHEDDAVA
jgi:hypothetical protein